MLFLILALIFLGVGVAFISFALINWAYMLLTGNGWWFRDLGGHFDSPALWQAVGVSSAVGLTNFLATRLGTGWLAWLSILLFGVMVAAFVGLFIWWGKEGSLPLEMVPFALLALLFALVMGGPASVLAGLVAPVAILASIIAALPWIAFWGFIGFMVVSTLFYHYNKNGGALRRYLVLAIIALVLFGTIVLSMTGVAVARGVEGTDFSSWSWSEFWDKLLGRGSGEITDMNPDPSDMPSLPPADEGPTGPTVADIKSQWDIGNDKLILNNYDPVTGQKLEGDKLAEAKLDDQNFGPGILEEAWAIALSQNKVHVEDMAGKTPGQLYEMVGADAVMTALVNRWAYDPIAGAGAMVYYDALMGTRWFAGDFITEAMESHPDVYARALNGAKDAWLLDKPTYYNKLNYFLSILYSADRIVIRYQDSGITDQLYVTGPIEREQIDTIMQDLIVFESYDHSGYFVTFEWTVKETGKRTMSLRLDCGGQPCNVSELFGVTPEPNPNGTKPPSSNPPQSTKPPASQPPTNTGNPSGGDPSPSPTGNPSGGDPNPGTTKDPSQGTQIPGNDVTGPGPNTNTGPGGQYSSVQTPDGSIFDPTYEDYENSVGIIESNPGRPGGTDNNPSYTPPPSTTVTGTDNNGDNGYGWGGANDPTGTKPPAEVDVPGYNPGSGKVEWGGPPL